jgi:hypothetical protein
LRDCKVTSSTKHYHQFAKRWNEVVAERFTNWCNGDDVVVQMNYKSTQQLMDYFDELKEWKSIQASTPAEDTDRSQLNNDLRDGRMRIQGGPPVPFHVCPPALHGNVITPLGHPNTLNADIAIGAIGGLGSREAPFVILRPTFTEGPMAPPKEPVRYVFRSKKYCSTCGWRRREHKPDEGMQTARDPCKRTYCGNCYMIQQHHVDNEGNSVPMGHLCPLPPNQYCASLRADWYEKRVRHLFHMTLYYLITDANRIALLFFQGG